MVNSMVDERLLNPAFIKEVFKEDIISILKKVNEISHWYLRYGYSINGIEPYDGKLKFKLDIIENYLLFLEQKRDHTMEEQRIINNFRQLYMNLFKYHHECMVGSRILKYHEYFFQNNDFKLVRQEIRAIIERANSLHRRFILGEKLKPSDINFLFEMFIQYLDTGSEEIKEEATNLVKMLLNSDKDYGLLSKNFLIQYFNHQKCKADHNKDALIYISNEYLGDNEVHRDLGVSYGDTGIISISRFLAEGILNKKISFYGTQFNKDALLLTTLFHELKHYEMSNKIMSGAEFDIESLHVIMDKIFPKYLSKTKLDEYKLNYKYRQSEQEANVFGLNMAGEVLSKIVSRKEEALLLKSKAKSIDYEQSAGYQTDSETFHKQDFSIYNILNLSKIIKKHPKLLNKYKILNIFYNSNGDLKDLSELVDTYTKIELNECIFLDYKINLNIFDEFFKVLIVKEGIQSFSFRQPENNLISWFQIIIALLYNEIAHIERLYEVSGNIPKDSLKHFVSERGQLIKMYKSYIDKFKYYIILLKEYNAFNNKRVIFEKIDLDLLDQKYAETITKLDALNKSLNETFYAL